MIPERKPPRWSAPRAAEAMLKMTKLDIAELKRAHERRDA
jgi:predicted 3-demethylubiquinone-9 3-methyltransferase (glyoxalase superfamily)